MTKRVKLTLTGLNVARQVAAFVRQCGPSAARNIGAAISGEIRIVKGHPVVTTRVIWVVWALAFIATGDLPTNWFGFVTSLVRLGLSAILLARWWRHSGQQRWRTTRGRMNEPITGNGDAATASLVEELQATVAANNARIDSLRTALAEAFKAAGREVPQELATDVPTGPMLRLVKSDGSDVVAG
jgi:hypothetical protein